MSVREATREAADNEWVEKAARVGIAARGTAFLILAYLLARIAAGALGGDTPENAASGPGVAQAVAAQTGGRVIVFILGIGLVCFSLFSLLEAILRQGGASSKTKSSAKKWGKRGAATWRCVLYGAFAGYAFYTAFTGGDSTGKSRHEGNKQSNLSAEVLNWPAGWLWLGAVGAVLFAIAGFNAVRAARRSFMKRLETGRMSQRSRRSAEILGCVGHAGRAGLFATVGWFVTGAAIENDPEHGRGLDGSIRHLVDGGWGAALVSLFAATLIAFGIYLFIDARYRSV